MPQLRLSLIWKRRLARLMRLPLLHKVMALGVHLTVPCQRVGVAVVALDREERVLMLRHVFHPYCPWGLPGGWLNRSESPAAGALRELVEETGLTADFGSVVYIASENHPPHIGIAFLASIQPGPITLSPEIIEATWFPITGLPHPLHSFTLDAINGAMKLRRALSPVPLSQTVAAAHNNQHSRLEEIKKER